MSEPRKTVFISCGQYSEEERSLGKRVAELVRQSTPFDGYFAENQTTLATLTENVLRRLYDSVGLIIIMHHRGTVETPTRKLTRASVWIEQEVAVATLMQQILGRPLHAVLFVKRGIAIEGIRQQLQLNAVEFVEGDEVIAKLKEILPSWKVPLYLGEDERRAMVDAVDLSVRIENGHHAHVTIDVENHSKLDVQLKSIVLWSKESRVCGPVPRPEGANWTIPAQRRLPIQFLANENVALKLANLYEQPVPVGDFPRSFRAAVQVELRCEILGLERVFKEKSEIQIDLLNRQLTGIR